jgi:glycosyltransferase involved in cell wall biosynthesis
LFGYFPGSQILTTAMNKKLAQRQVYPDLDSSLGASSLNHKVTQLHPKFSSPALPFESTSTGRLCIITQYYPPDYAPTGQLINDLANHLGAQGQKTYVFTGQPAYAVDCVAQKHEYLNKVTIRRSQATRFFSSRIRHKLVNGMLFVLRAGLFMLKQVKHQDTLLLTSAPPFLPILGWFGNLLFGIPYVCLIYDLYPEVVVNLDVASQTNLLVKFWEFCNRLTFSRAKGIIVMNGSMKERIVKKYPQLQQKISVIHNWTDPDKIVPLEKSENWFAQQHGLADKFTVLYSGNSGRCHDMETILEAALKLRDEPIQFVFIGDGASYQTCVNFAREQGLNNCLFLPYQDRSVLPYSLTACDVSLVSMKQGMEGVVAPSKLYSMLAAGRPVAAICESHSYLNHLIKDAKCGATFVNGDSENLSQFLRALASQPKVAQRMGRAGREYLVSNFTLEICAKQYARVLGLHEKAKHGLVSQAQSSAVRFNHRQRIYRRQIGQLLKEAGLLTEVQVNDILTMQSGKQHSGLKFGEIAVLKGWVRPEVVNSILTLNKPIGQLLREAGLLTEGQINDILKTQDIQHGGLRFGEVAVLKGWVHPDTINFVLRKYEPAL